MTEKYKPILIHIFRVENIIVKGGHLPDLIIWSGYIHDEFYAEDQRTHAADDFSRAISVLSDDIDFSKGILGPSGFYINVYIDGDDYSKTIHTLHMYSIINNSDVSITEDESRTKAADIVWYIMQEMGEKYCFTEIQAVYSDSNGSFSIYADSMFNRELTYKDILRNTQKKP
ncbi:MAG: hypothetical protein E7218_07500 [Anaerofustis stercorihominis]|nr:hypothetical protein [Anaerofustis stercorihominis]